MCFWYDVFLVRVTPPDTLAVELTLVRDSVGPVMAPLFDAVTQVAESLGPRRRAERTDTVRVHIRARYLPSGLPAVGASMRLIGAPVAGSGGHGHFDFRGRPGGTFFNPGEDVDVPDGGVRVQVRFPLPTSGDTVLVYRTSGVSGREQLAVQVTDGLQSQGLVRTMVVRWPGLVAMARQGTHHGFKNQDPNVPGQRHGNVNHWVEAGFRDRVLDAFRRYFEVVPEPRFPNPSPGGGMDTRFVITEASLEWGGLFDVAEVAPWRNPHRTHRKGVDVDVRSTTMNAARQEDFERACVVARVFCSREPNPSVPNNPPHYHLSPQRARQQ